ncbi:ATP-binding cassette domain-containing protein [Dethiobacter alkaliphilus]|uniref:ATP-binding cassette domain-containing protein n=1 Tax=Dethiobacter alkaliphilus TaxID=427926 RepID=UPI002226113E|nr:ATP-binding cassette domain-containing protein [Dethiobacter alkaliphilus]MCW3489692.1 ATP-binding cassette domain-containing protein [Dethiobacter alkaliphilus]
MKLQIQHVGKRFKDNTWGVRDFSLELTPGLLGLLGPKDAGKTTLLRMLATITKPTTGTIKWNGEDIEKNPFDLRPDLGYLPQGFGVFPNLTVNDFLRQAAAVKGMSAKTAEQKTEELLQQFNLIHQRNKALSELSAGERQLAGLAQALINNPNLLILDEPAAGLNKKERENLNKLLSDLSKDRIIIMATSDPCHIDGIATEIAVIIDGELQRHSLSSEEQLVQYC